MLRISCSCASSPKMRISSLSLKAFCSDQTTTFPAGSKIWNPAPRIRKNFFRIMYVRSGNTDDADCRLMSRLLDQSDWMAHSHSHTDPRHRNEAPAQGHYNGV